MHKRTDANHKSLIHELKAIGASVTDTSMVGRGFPDFVVGYRGINYLAEVKVRGGKLIESQIDFRDQWTGNKPFVITCLEDFLENVNG
jgi:hypothetical protein